MTRLKTEWVDYMVDGMDEYNRGLKEKTGFDLAGLVKSTYGITDEAYDKFTGSLLVAAVPVTQGEGIIGSFSDAVAAIIKSMGFNAFATEETDVDGIYSAILRDAGVIFMADDDRYLAFSRDNGSFGDNNYSTALGYIMALRAMMRKEGFDISKEKLLVIGYGIVGEEAADILSKHDIDFDMYDKDPGARESFKSLGLKGRVLESGEEIKNYSFILDFTNEGGWLRDDLLGERVLYASPGVPLSLDEKAKARLQNTAVYDNLEIGTAMMLGEIIKTWM